MRKLKDFKTQISEKDASMFAGELCVLKNVDFEKIFVMTFLQKTTEKNLGISSNLICIRRIYY